MNKVGSKVRWVGTLAFIVAAAALGVGCAQSSCSLSFTRTDGSKGTACAELQTTASINDADFSKFCSDQGGTFTSLACVRDNVVASCLLPSTTTTDRSGNKVTYQYQYFYYSTEGITVDEAKGYCTDAKGTFYEGDAGG